MLKTALTLIIATSFLCACATGPEGYLKKSANNKVFDRKGFQGGKRSPLYNKKYISQAKKNIIKNNLDEDMDYDNDNEFSENTHPYRDNIEMYKTMIDEDRERKRKRENKSSWWWSKKKKQPYPSAADSRQNLDPEINSRNLELREELDQIKSMLKDTKREMASYKCPNSADQERGYKSSQDMHLDTLPRPTLNLRIPQDLKQKTMEIDAKHPHPS